MIIKANGHLEYKKRDLESCEIRNILSHEVCVVPIDIAQGLKKLNGKRSLSECFPNASKAELKEIYALLREKHLLKDGKRSVKDGKQRLYAIWNPRFKRESVAIATRLHYLLIMTWMPVFILGIILLKRKDIPVQEGPSPMATWLGMFLGLIIGMLLHELGHMIASLRYELKIYELGLFLNGISAGAYCLIDTEKESNRMHRFQINLAGIKMNILFAGIMFILSSASDSFYYFCRATAFVNVGLGITNMFLWQGADGLSAFSELLNIPDICNYASQSFQQKNKNSLKKIYGVNKYAVSFLLAFIRISQWIYILCFVAINISFFVWR